MRSLVLYCFFVSLFSCVFLKKNPQPQFEWPLREYQLTQKFRPFKKRPHLGIDLRASLGSPVLSSRPGRVVYAGKKLAGYGNVVLIEHSRHWASLYAHLQSIQVSIGQKVFQGEMIGTLGWTGRATGPHLHFELIYKRKAVNPLFYLP